MANFHEISVEPVIFDEIFNRKRRSLLIDTEIKAGDIIKVKGPICSRAWIVITDIHKNRIGFRPYNSLSDRSVAAIINH